MKFLHTAPPVIAKRYHDVTKGTLNIMANYKTSKGQMSQLLKLKKDSAINELWRDSGGFQAHNKGQEFKPAEYALSLKLHGKLFTENISYDPRDYDSKYNEVIHKMLEADGLYPMPVIYFTYKLGKDGKLNKADANDLRDYFHKIDYSKHHTIAIGSSPRMKQTSWDAFLEIKQEFDEKNKKELKVHLLGCVQPDLAPAPYSADSSTYAMSAAKGYIIVFTKTANTTYLEGAYQKIFIGRDKDGIKDQLLWENYPHKEAVETEILEKLKFNMSDLIENPTNQFLVNLYYLEKLAVFITERDNNKDNLKRTIKRISA